MAIMRRILDRIEAVPVKALEAARADKSPLWQALDDIEDMVLEHEVGDLVRRAVGLDSDRKETP